MKIEVINTLQSSLADLTYIFFVMRKEFDLIIQNSDDEKVKNKLQQTILALQDSNNEVIKLYHEIKSNEVGIENEWYNEESKIKSLQHEVENLKNSINILLDGNRNYLNLNCR